MHSFIFCTSYIDNNHPAHSSKRYKRWIDYYYNKLEFFQADALFILDDGSPDIYLNEDVNIVDPVNLPSEVEKKINLVHFADNLGRPSQRDYRGWWRSFSSAIILAEKYRFDKFIHIESDFFIVSREMIDYVRRVSFGWTAFYSNFFNFPESGIQIICKDSFKVYTDLYENLFFHKFSINKSAEWHLPFSHVEKKFAGDRLGEFEVFNILTESQEKPIKLDWIGQILPHFEVSDFEPFFEFQYKWV